MEETTASSVLAENVETLMARDSMRPEQLARKANISIRTLTNVRKGKNPTLETIESIARVWRLEAFELLIPDNIRGYTTPEAERVKRAYAAADKAGKEAIDNAVFVAERLSEFGRKPS